MISTMTRHRLCPELGGLVWRHYVKLNLGYCAMMMFKEEQLSSRLHGVHMRWERDAGVRIPFR